MTAPVGGRSDRDLNLGRLNNSANFAASCTNLVFKNDMSVSQGQDKHNSQSRALAAVDWPTLVNIGQHWSVIFKFSLEMSFDYIVCISTQLLTAKEIIYIQHRASRTHGFVLSSFP